MPKKLAPTAPGTPTDLEAHLRDRWPSQAAFARAAGVSPVALSHYFAGRRGFSPRVAQAIRKSLLTKERRSPLTLERLLGVDR